MRVGGSRSDFVARSRYACQELLKERATLHSPAKRMFSDIRPIVLVLLQTRPWLPLHSKAVQG